MSPKVSGPIIVVSDEATQKGPQGRAARIRRLSQRTMEAAVGMPKHASAANEEDITAAPLHLFRSEESTPVPSQGPCVSLDVLRFSA